MFQRRILGISWEDKVSNDKVRNEPVLENIELIITERRLNWLRHVLLMDDKRLQRQTIFWVSEKKKESQEVRECIE